MLGAHDFPDGVRLFCPFSSTGEHWRMNRQWLRFDWDTFEQFSFEIAHISEVLFHLLVQFDSLWFRLESVFCLLFPLTVVFA